MTDVTLVGYPTTFVGMFKQAGADVPSVRQVEIPLIQRDYAQGREDERTQAIRTRFLDALHAALTTDASVGLDFVYGEVRDGSFEPLDGQQRLTTLFLLHWYVATRCGIVCREQTWSTFTYATRPSARLFCERIVLNQPATDLTSLPGEWIKDQSWYLHLWRFDPTIRAMLVTLDAIAERFRDDDPERLWRRLSDEASPAIWFQLLPIAEMGAADELYIKMNSRGKPLTAFEAFKAHLGPLIAAAGGPEDFGHRIDGPWTDLLWSYRGLDDVVDDEFMRFFDFLMEICEWREGRVGADGRSATAEQRMSELLAEGNPLRQEHLRLICSSFDDLVGGPPVRELFAQLFTTQAEAGRVRLFGAETTDLFGACCQKYGGARGATRLFSLTDTLLLYAVLVHRIHGTQDAASRLRTVRNLNEASQFELRVQNMPKLVREVEAFMLSGDLTSLSTFNQNQVADEERKRALLADQPALAAAVKKLEDHNILRGTLAAFELDAALASRSTAFEALFQPDLWMQLTAGLLAVGEYQRDYSDSDQHRFGSPTTRGVWRLMLVDRGDREALRRVREVVGTVLDRFSDSQMDAGPFLHQLASEYLARSESTSRFDWRYYLVRYDAMREGDSGIYFGADGSLGYEMTMLRKTVQRSWYRDAYLYAIWVEAGRPTEVEDPWFYGYSTEPRWMTLSRSGTGLRSVSGGFVVRAPQDAGHAEVLAQLCASTGRLVSDNEWLLPVKQEREAGSDGPLLDAEDRVQQGRRILDGLLAAGL